MRTVQRGASDAPLRTESVRRRQILAARAAARPARRRRQDVQLRNPGGEPHSAQPPDERTIMTSAVIVSTARTPLCKSWKGSFNMTHGATLGGHAVQHAI